MPKAVHPRHCESKTVVRRTEESPFATNTLLVSVVTETACAIVYVAVGAWLGRGRAGRNYCCVTFNQLFPISLSLAGTTTAYYRALHRYTRLIPQRLYSLNIPVSYSCSVDWHCLRPSFRLSSLSTGPFNGDKLQHKTHVYVMK